MKKFACIICGRDKQGAVICLPCRQANIRLLKYVTPEEAYIVMMYPRIMNEFIKGRKKKGLDKWL